MKFFPRLIKLTIFDKDFTDNNVASHVVVISISNNFAHNIFAHGTYKELQINFFFTEFFSKKYSN